MELFINKVAESSRNGVVGSNGKKIPKTPSDSEIRPNVARMYLTIRFEGCFIILVTYYRFSVNPILLCVPSQNGRDEDLPHLQSATVSAFANFMP